MARKPPPRSPSRHERFEYWYGLQLIHEHEELNSSELGELLGLCRRNAGEYLRIWHYEGLVHIKKWVHQTDTRGAYRAVYALRLNDEKDAPMPKPLSRAEVARRHRKNARMKIKIRRAASRGTLSMFTQLQGL